MSLPADGARAVAWEVLRAVDEHGAYANLLLPALLRDRRLPARERAFATELTYGTLRAQGLLDTILAQASSRPLAQVDPPLRDALRLGAYQLLRTRVPPHAAVAATVELVRATSGERPVRFANAVLRKVAARVTAAGGDLTVLLRVPAYDDDPVGHLAAVTAHPRWVVHAFRDAFGGDLGETRAALSADDVRPVTHLAARPGRIERDVLLKEAERVGLAASAGPWSPYAVRLDAGDPARLPPVRDGRAGVQDEGSQLVALALARTPTAGGPDRGRTVDLCAGPGGKAALLTGLLAGGTVLGLEPRPARARLVADAGVLVVRADGRHPPLPPASADRVLVDVPCTGLGALRRRPEARWRRRPADLPALVTLQRELLGAALDLARPGGVVAYATCSPHPAETTDVVRGVLAAQRDVEPVDARSALPAMPDLGTGPYVQLWPHRHGTDAMFLALLLRR